MMELAFIVGRQTNLTSLSIRNLFLNSLSLADCKSTMKLTEDLLPFMMADKEAVKIWLSPFQTRGHF